MNFCRNTARSGIKTSRSGEVELLALQRRLITRYFPYQSLKPFAVTLLAEPRWTTSRCAAWGEAMNELVDVTSERPASGGGRKLTS
jgi:hypothetical protein